MAGHPAESLGLDDVLGIVVGITGESVVVGRGFNHYPVGYRSGPVTVLEAPGRPDMGIQVNVDGSGCEELGLVKVAELYRDLAMEDVTRLDWAFDNPDLALLDRIEAAWRADDVRTRAKAPDPEHLARKGLSLLPEYQGVRRCSVREEPWGRTFYMGSRSSSRCARAYNRRGYTRLEVELSGERAALVAAELLTAVLVEPDLVPEFALGHLRDFVDFVDAKATSNRARAPLLDWWGAFVDGARRAGLSLSGEAPRTLEGIRTWFEDQVAPSLALLVEAFGWDAIERVAERGRARWRPRHQLVRRVPVPVQRRGPLAIGSAPQASPVAQQATASART